MDSENMLRQHTTRKQKLYIILALAVPAMIENLLQTVVGFIDTLFVSKIGLVEVTAVGISNAIIAIYIAIFMALGTGASSLIARSVGANDYAKAKLIAKQSTWIATITGLLFGLISLLFARPLLQIMGAETNVLEAAVTYFTIVAVPSVFISLMFVFGSILRAAGDTKTPMKISIWINIVHVVLDYVLIFGVWKFEGWGIAGAAWATVIVRIIGSIALYRYIKKSKLSFPMFTGIVLNEHTKALLKLSTPAAIERLIMRLGQVLYFGLIVHIGTNTFAAHTVAGNIEIFSYMPGYGLAVAATILVGQNLGANQKKEAYAYGMLTTGVAVAFMSFVGALLFFFSSWFAAWFTSEPTVIKMVSTALKIDAFAQPFLAVGLVLTGALQGAGDTKSPMYSTAIGMWVIRVVGVYVLGIQLGMGIAGIWLSITIDLFVRAVYLFYRFRKQLS
ncbi:MATE family efflux transporter [Paenibacillus mendelii]|uniref:Probable multidrug resistance protein NorM n=1 Tax=Paenibacillus mendelii TaxID=206163 RepID=A0ABV6JGQ9_9BACL|nr:MATE family efflux transporter [Paenibacillus mendelii]MCQ6563814.1 MATE family efflux transporter [Paenibacillus mendelii]